MPFTQMGKMDKGGREDKLLCFLRGAVVAGRRPVSMSLQKPLRGNEVRRAGTLGMETVMALVVVRFWYET